MIDWNVPVTIARVGNTVVNVKLPKLSGMIKSLPLILIAATLVGCYVPNDRLWNLRVREKVTVGIPLDRALAQLHEMKIACESTMPSASGTLGCPTRNQKSPLLPFVTGWGWPICDRCQSLQLASRNRSTSSNQTLAPR